MSFIQATLKKVVTTTLSLVNCVRWRTKIFNLCTTMSLFTSFLSWGRGCRIWWKDSNAKCVTRSSSPVYWRTLAASMAKWMRFWKRRVTRSCPASCNSGTEILILEPRMCFKKNCRVKKKIIFGKSFFYRLQQRCSPIFHEWARGGGGWGGLVSKL